jgi:glycosyltransferase involved in cell wall biosynthesis
MTQPTSTKATQSRVGLDPPSPVPDLSVVVPIYNEADNLRALRLAIGHTLDHSRWSYEVVFVDDASTDRSREVYEEMLAEDPYLRVVLFRSNCGQTAAMAAGFKYSRGDVVITMDGDLQNDPADIPRLLEVLDQGHDIVCGWRRERKDRALTRLLPSKLANLMISTFHRVPIHDTGCSLKAYRGWVVRNLTLYSDMHRFIAALSVGVGARITELPVRHHPRRFGVSKYGLTRIFKVMADLIVVKMLIQFSAHPVRWFSFFGAFIFVMTLGLVIVGLFKFESTGISFSRRYDIMWISAAGMNLLVALNLFLLGLLAELQLKSSGFFRRRASMSSGDRIL